MLAADDLQHQEMRVPITGTGAGCCKVRSQNLSALISRGSKRMLRNWTFLLFTFLVPALQVVLFCVAIGQNPNGLRLAVVNQDAGIDTVPTIFGPLPLPTVNLGDQFLAQIDESIVLDYYNNSDLALNAVRRGKAWGVLYLQPTFTEATFLRYIPGFNVTEDVLQASTVMMNLDTTNQQIFAFMQQQINSAYNEFLHSELDSLVEIGIKLNPREADLPVDFGTPIFGSSHPRFTDFIAPGMIINIAFASSIGLTALAFVIDKREGSLDRVYSCGVYPSELIIGHLIIQFFVLAIQVGLLLFCALYVFSLPLVGSLLWVVLLTMLLGFSGMLYGLVISASCEKEQEAIQMSMGSFFPVMLLSGVIWPVQAIPAGLKWLSLALPTTWAAGAMRSVLNRGWDMSYQDVYTGFAVVSGWCILFGWMASSGLRNRD
jgi:huntingtin